MFEIYEGLGTQALWFKYSKDKKITELFLDSFDAIKDKLGGSIVHPNHQADYSFKVYKKILRKYHAIQSMPCVGNSLDNRVVNFD